MDEPIRVPPTPSMRRYAEQKGYSPEILARWNRFYDDVLGLVAAQERPPDTWIRMNPLAGDPDETLDRLERKGFRLTAGPLAQAWRVDEAPLSPGASHEYLLGRYQLQDLSTQLAVPALEPAPGERVLDLAAAPGGKTIQMAQAMDNEGVIHAFEIDPDRAQGLRSNLARCGVQNVVVHVRDGAGAVELPGTADRVLLDAPCTGEGVIRRDPTRKKGYLEEYAACARQQSALLRAGVEALRPGGVLVYATCTLAPEENEFQVNRALRDLPVRLEALPEAVSGLRLGGADLTPGLVDVDGHKLDPTLEQTAHTLPHRHGCLGFYLARLRKEDD